MRFLDEKVIHDGPTSHSEIEWRGFERAVEGHNGMFLRVQRGIHIYVPYDAVEPKDASKEIIARINQGYDA